MFGFEDYLMYRGFFSGRPSSELRDIVDNYHKQTAFKKVLITINPLDGRDSEYLAARDTLDKRMNTVADLTEKLILA